MTWKHIDLHGSVRISRLVGEYRIYDHIRLPSNTSYRIKVFEEQNDFLALPNLGFRAPDGSVDGICGIGATEIEALQEAVARMSSLLARRPKWEEDDLDWSDPRDF